jgi:hypothetical protein
VEVAAYIIQVRHLYFHDLIIRLLPAESTAPHEGDVVSTRYTKKLTRKQAREMSMLRKQANIKVYMCICMHERVMQVRIPDPFESASNMKQAVEPQDAVEAV